MFAHVAEVWRVLERHGISRDDYDDVPTFLAVMEQHLPDHVAAGRMNGKTILLEAISEELLRLSLVGVTKHSEKDDVLTLWKQQDRLSHEVYARDGVVDPAVRKGMFGRALNEKSPHLNSRDGHFPGRRVTSDNTNETRDANTRKAMHS